MSVELITSFRFVLKTSISRTCIFQKSFWKGCNYILVFKGLALSEAVDFGRPLEARPSCVWVRRSGPIKERDLPTWDGRSSIGSTLFAKVGALFPTRLSILFVTMMRLLKKGLKRGLQIT